MAQHEIEVILTRELASYLATAVFVVDRDGELIYYNEPAELLLGTRFDETGPMPMADWSRRFAATAEDGRLLDPPELPLVATLATGRPQHGRFWIRGLDGRRHLLEATAIPLLGQGGRRLGATALFWEPPATPGGGPVTRP